MMRFWLRITHQVPGIAMITFYYDCRGWITHRKQWAGTLAIISPEMILEALVIMPAPIERAVDTSFARDWAFCRVHIVFYHLNNLFKPNINIKKMPLELSM
jgi:hypothetical protein